MSNLQELENELGQIMTDRAALSERGKAVQRAIDAERKLTKVREMSPQEREQMAQAIQAVGIESAEASDAQGGAE